jgi:hypothetical protein
VTNFVVDVPYAWGIQFSGLITLGSGPTYNRGYRDEGNFEANAIEPERFSFIIPDAWAYRNVDLRLRKDFIRVRGTGAGVTLDLFNAFNYKNVGCYSDTPNTASADYGRATCALGDAQRFQLGVEYNF